MKLMNIKNSTSQSKEQEGHLNYFKTYHRYRIPMTISASSVRAVPLNFYSTLLRPLCLGCSAEDNQSNIRTSQLTSVRMRCRARSEQTAPLSVVDDAHGDGEGRLCGVLMCIDGKVANAERRGGVAVSDVASRNRHVFKVGVAAAWRLPHHAHHFSCINFYLTRLQRRFSKIVKLENLGKSYEKRAIKLVKISTCFEQPKPVILIDAGIHAREWIAPAMALYIIHQLVENPDNTRLIQSVEWHIVPVLNPDGYEYSHTHERFWRKTRSRIHGVDGNRNYDFQWGKVTKCRNPRSCNYIGTRPFSELETSALRDHVLKHKKVIKLYLSFHNRASGGSDDWMKSVGGIALCYTIELPGGGQKGFDLPAAEILPTVSQFFPCMRVFEGHIRAYLLQLATNYPTLVTVENIGFTYEGRPIVIAKISSGGQGSRPVIAIEAGIHAREWIAPATAVYIINQLVENSENSDLISNVDWHIVPVTNPDGYEFSHTTTRLWRKTRSRPSSSTCIGTDPNRNFGHHWMLTGASSNPCSETYGGTHAFSESETVAYHNYILGNKDRIKLYLATHSYGNVNAAAGGSDDWVKAVGGVDYAYTLELPGGGNSGFDLPASQIARTVSTFFPAIRIRAYLLQLATNYPTLVTVENIGFTYEGRPIVIAKISSGGQGSRPVIAIEAGIHAREWIAPATAVYIINQLVENSENSDLISNVDWHIVPVTNPDGYEFSHTTTYGGTHAFSEPETVAYHNYILGNKDRIKLYLATHSYGNIREYLLQLATNYPTLVTVENIGFTYEGRPIVIAKISSGGQGSRPVIAIEAGIHAREWIAPATAVYIINQLVENSENSDLISSVDWHIVPVTNPDGYEFSHTTTRLWRKTRSRMSSSICIGTDPNRNFDFYWMEGGASSNPCSDTYAGSHGFSEPETSAYHNYILENKDRIKLYLATHSYGNYFLYPWGYTEELPEDWRDLDNLARSANAAQIAAGAPNYTIDIAAGGSDDWVRGVGGVKYSYTVELPGGGIWGFDLPASRILSTVTSYFPAIRVFGNYIKDNYA
uniref:(California timema) hypothetical protein n=1 Tax=Timema californicum TaxID=61474 RepID=A0A7R9P4P3_TIMCA|nr:unnamed protein product [Timema californicum]